MRSTRMGLLLLGVVVGMELGCSRRSYDGPKRYPLSGTVTIDDEAIDVGMVAFIPTNAEQQRPSGGEIVAGQYSIPEEKGANAGDYRVEIHWWKKTGKQFKEPLTETMQDERKEGVPKKFNEQSELRATVPGDKPTLDFALRSK